MKFADLPAGSTVFLDANTLVYHFAADPQFGSACTDLVKRIERKELVGFVSTHVLSDVAHRLMTVEAILLNGWPLAGIAQRLRRNHAEIAKLTRFRQAVEEVPQLGIQVLPPTLPHVLAAAVISQQYELLSGDALVAAIMQANGINYLATNDADFDRVRWIMRYTPV
jgi:predicted nucleic acid-binding protein